MKTKEKLRVHKKKRNNAVIITAHYFDVKPDLSQGYFLEWNINGLWLSLCRRDLKTVFIRKDINQGKEESLVSNNVCIISTLGCVAWLKNKYPSFLYPTQWKIFVVRILLYNLLCIDGDIKQRGFWRLMETKSIAHL